VTIDETAHDYLPLLFGQHGWALVHRPQDLVQRLAGVHAALTRIDPDSGAFAFIAPGWCSRACC
jgi:hypothetical protein